MVQAVLLTVMVMAIGLLAVASRVYSSRQGAAASSLQAAARQAAEFGFSETVAEMNRDDKGYLWVLCKEKWSSITDDELKAKGIYSGDSVNSSPITLTTNLPESTELSYKIDKYIPPLYPEDDPTKFCDTNTFGNLKGGNATLTIIGTAKRASGDVTTYTIKRSVSVGSAMPEFRNPWSTDSGISNSGADPRFPHFPTPAQLGATPPAGPWADATLPSTFPKDPSDSSQPLSYCQETTSAWVCMVNDLTVNGNVFATTSGKPINIFVKGTTTIKAGSRFCTSDDGTSCSASNSERLKVRVFGSAAAATTCSQIVDLTSSAANVKGFFWFPAGELRSSTSSPVDGVAGSFCKAPAIPSSVTLIAPQDLLDGLRDLRLLRYRGYGSQEQAP